MADVSHTHLIIIILEGYKRRRKALVGGRLVTARTQDSSPGCGAKSCGVGIEIVHRHNDMLLIASFRCVVVAAATVVFFIPCKVNNFILHTQIIEKII